MCDTINECKSSYYTSSISFFIAISLIVSSVERKKTLIYQGKRDVNSVEGGKKVKSRQHTSKGVSLSDSGGNGGCGR